jgi:hypothetical protein
MKQTAVESILEKLNNVKPMQFCSIETIKKWVEEAKAMEKEQIENACDRFANSIDFTIEDFELYYNETYGK